SRPARSCRGHCSSSMNSRSSSARMTSWRRIQRFYWIGLGGGGRAFVLTVFLGSQRIGGTSGLSRSPIGQMAIRIALQTSEADSQLILGDNNSAARLLTRPGEAIYNDAGGLVEGNSPFQVAWLPDEQRDTY